MPPRLFSPDPLIGDVIEGFRIKRVRGTDFRTGWVYYSAQNPLTGSWASVIILRPEGAALRGLAKGLRFPPPSESEQSIGIHRGYLYILRKEPKGRSLGELLDSKRPPSAPRVVGIVSKTMDHVVSNRRGGIRGTGLSEHDIFVGEGVTIAEPVVLRKGGDPIPPSWLRRSAPPWAKNATDPRLIAFDALDILTHGITRQRRSLAKLTPKFRTQVLTAALDEAGISPSSPARINLESVLGGLERRPSEDLLEQMGRQMRRLAVEAGALRGPRAARPLPRPETTAGERVGPEGPRFVNLSFRSEKDRAVAPARPLVAGRSYQLRVSIGSLSSDSVVENAAANPVPVHLLPQSDHGHWLKVAAVSKRFEVSTAARWLFLPKTGPAFVCPCQVNAPHRCAEKHRLHYIDFPVTAPREIGTAHVRVTIYFETSVVQSLLVTAEIVRTPRAKGSNTALIDYNLSNGLTDLDAVRPRALGIVMNDDDDGSHLIVFNGAPNDVVPLHVTEGQLTSALTVMRTVMRKIHIDDRGQGEQKANRYDATNRKPHEEFLADLQELALRGWELWNTLWGRLINVWKRNRDSFVGSSDIIHVARKKNSVSVFPWAIVYDIPIEVGAPEKNRLCRLLEKDEWRKFQTSQDAARRCPFEKEHRANVICPYGFWGYRYGIENPPSLEVGQARKQFIPADPQPLDLVLALSDDLDPGLQRAHVQALAALRPMFTIHECRSRDQIKQGLGLRDLEVAYFYCHGLDVPLPGGAGVTPRLGVGRKQAIDPPDLTTWLMEWPNDHWQSSAPLVFINGCHTADTTPQTLVNFVDTFSASLAAAGVIGTEITLHQQVANEVGLTFLDAFRGGAGAVEALHRARIGLLRKGNLLGLVYTAYCCADLRLGSSAS